jgi:RHS repeat-associated protein
VIHDRGGQAAERYYYRVAFQKPTGHHAASADKSRAKRGKETYFFALKMHTFCVASRPQISSCEPHAIPVHWFLDVFSARQPALAPELPDLAARSRLTEKPRLGHQLPTAALHPGIGFAISNTALCLRFPMYDFRGGPLRSGYFRDFDTGLDYANNRYHNPGTGRFMTPDPYAGSVSLRDPGSWNRYAYVYGDPINYLDPSGLCTAMLAGVTMSPDDSSPFDQTQINLGGVAGFPYSGLNSVYSVEDIYSQAAFGPNASTQVALDTLLSALNGNSGSIDVIAYSGGAQAFATAFGELSAAQQARIGNILYISPGMLGTLPTTANLSNTSVIWGTDATDIMATIGTSIPPGVQITQTNCDHTNLTCLLSHAQSQLATFADDGPCSSQGVYALDPSSLVFSAGFSGGGGGGGGGSRKNFGSSWPSWHNPFEAPPREDVHSTITFGPIAAD